MEKRLGVHRRAAPSFRKLILSSETLCFSASASKAIKHLIKDVPTAAISQIGTKNIPNPSCMFILLVV